MGDAITAERLREIEQGLLADTAGRTNLCYAERDALTLVADARAMRALARELRTDLADALRLLEEIDWHDDGTDFSPPRCQWCDAVYKGCNGHNPPEKQCADRRRATALLAKRDAIAAKLREEMP